MSLSYSSLAYPHLPRPTEPHGGILAVSCQPSVAKRLLDCLGGTVHVI